MNMTRDKLPLPGSAATTALSAAILAAAAGLAGCGSSQSDTPGGGSDVPVSTGCGDLMDEARFADATKLRELLAASNSFGLRSPGSESDRRHIDWIVEQMRALPGVQVHTDPYEIMRWQPEPVEPDGYSRSLERAGLLTVVPAAGPAISIPAGGAVPFALPTGVAGRTGPLVYLPSEVAITSGNASGKVVIRDYPVGSIPYAAFAALSWYQTPDLLANVAANYERPYLGAVAQSQDLKDAGMAGASGVVFSFNVPRDQIAGYWDPHDGTNYALPAVHVGVDEGEQLKLLATAGANATVAVLAQRDRAITRNVVVTIPGQSTERIILNANHDGNTWVQENGVAGLIALAAYFSRRPLECRPRTIEIALGASHLALSQEGTDRYATQLDYDDGTIAFAFPIEHIGTREILPAARTDGPGARLEITGMGESMGWFSGESAPMVAAIIGAVQRRGLDRMAVLKGAALPSATIPAFCSFGGLGNIFHPRLIPTMAIISGPWSLWAPSFGESAIDFDRMRDQLLAVGDVILELDDVPREIIAGPYLVWRYLLAAGAPGCPSESFPEDAPSAGNK